MKKQNRFLVIATMVISIVALFSSSVFAKDLEFVLISKYVHPWFDVGNEGFKKAAAEIGGIKTRYLQPLTAEGKDQVKMMEDVIAEKPDGIAIAVNAPEALLPIINEAMKMGIKVVTWDDTSMKSDQLMFFGTDNFAAGVAEGEEYVKMTGGEGNYIIICHEITSTNTKQRIDGIRSVTAKYPKLVELIDEQPTGFTMGDALSVIENLLAAHGDKNPGFIDTNLLGTIALHQTLKERNIAPGQVPIVTWTLLDPIVAAIKDGYAPVSIRQNTFAMGYLALYGLKMATDGLKPSTNFFSTGFTLATKENMAGVEEINIKKAPMMLKEMRKLWH
ncbi:MAG: substrate-binding domain-containing protein [Bacteroidetes bacterium]|nr:substrate-binding domain-containing protein [Bacteroidota bacterium]